MTRFSPIPRPPRPSRLAPRRAPPLESRPASATTATATATATLRLARPSRLPRVVAVFGAPEAGVSTVLRGVYQSLHVQGHAVELWEHAQARSAELEALDLRLRRMGDRAPCLLVDGLPSSVDELQQLFELGWLTAADGVLVRLDRPQRPEGIGFHWGPRLAALEARARLLSVHLTSAVNGEGPAATGRAIHAVLVNLTRWSRQTGGPRPRRRP